LIFVKENIHVGRKFLVDPDDQSIMRTDKHFKALFKEAGLDILEQSYQKDMPEDLHKVCCYVLRNNAN
jgi:protein N-terminal methyltransferase